MLGNAMRVSEILTGCNPKSANTQVRTYLRMYLVSSDVLLVRLNA